MVDNENYSNLLYSFKDLFGDLATNNKYKQSYEELSDFLGLLIAHQYFASNLNKKIGFLNLEPKIRKNLRQVLTSIPQSRASFDSQKVFITRLSKMDYSKDDQASLNLMAFQNGLNRKGQIVQESILIAYYRNNFHFLNQFRNKKEFTLEKNILRTAPILNLTTEFQIIVQNRANTNPKSPIDNQKLVSYSKKFKQFFNRQNKLLQTKNISFNAINQFKQKLSAKYKEIIQFQFKLYESNQAKQSQIYKLNNLLKTKIDSLTLKWSTQSNYRIGLISLPSIDNKKLQQKESFFFQEKLQIFQSKKKDPNFKIVLKQFPFDQKLVSNKVFDEIRLIKQLILMNIIFQKNQEAVIGINHFESKLQFSLYSYLKENQTLIENRRIKKLQKIKRTSSLSDYQNLSIRSLFLSWNKKIAEDNKTKIPILCIELGDMYLANEFKYSKVRCEFTISYYDKKKRLVQSAVKIKNYSYQFDEDTDDWNIKLTPELEESSKIIKDSNIKNTSTLLFDISQVHDFFDLQLKITLQSKNTSITGLVVISKFEKLKSFGQNEQLILYEQNLSSQRIVGFINLFYLIKQHYDINQVTNFNLSKYRNIKLLEKIGRLPSNYYQPTFIDFNPNKLLLFCQLLNLKNKKISKLNFQQTYLSLVSLLQREKMDQRRTKFITERSTNVLQSGLRASKLSVTSKEKLLQNTPEQSIFFPYERLSKYENLLKIRLVKQVKAIFNPKFVYFFDEGGKIYQKIRSEYQQEQESLKRKKSQNDNKTLRQTKQVKQDKDKDLISRFVYFEIPSELDRISLRTSVLLNDSLKASMYQAQTLLVPNPHIETLSILSMMYSLNQINVQQSIVSIFIAVRENKDQFSKNFSQPANRKKLIQIEKTSKKIELIQTFNPYMVPLVNRIVTLVKQQRAQISQSKLAVSETNLQELETKTIDQTRVLQFTINFLSSMYPYFHPKSLQKQSLYIRYFVQKYLPQLNFQLNRRHIGLQNFISKYLLSLFSLNLEEEVTFQIWDFIIKCPNKFAARINCMLTLLIFLEKTDFNPIIPLGCFVNALKENYLKFDLSNHARKIADLMSQSLGQFFQKQHERKSKLYEIRDEKGNLLLGYEFFKRIMFDSERINKVNYIGNKKVNLNELRYKLPEPKYYGDPVEQVNIFLKSFFISETVSISGWSLIVKWQNTSSCHSILSQKNQIMNEFIKFKYPSYLKENSYELPYIEFIVAPNREEGRFFIGYLPIIHLHKDHIYSEQIRLIYIKGNIMQITNKGQNVIHVQVVLKSREVKRQVKQVSDSKQNLAFSKKNNLSATISKSSMERQINQVPANTINLNMEKEYHLNQQNRLDKIYDRLLDYSLNEDENEPIKEMKKLKHLFHRMKNPIDQFSQQKYTKLKIPFIPDNTFSQALMNSQLLIQQFQALIYNYFPQQEAYKINLPQIYKIFSKNTNFQMVFLTEILIEALLLDKRISFQQKIEYLYCLGKHYQNCGGTGLSVQTVDFLFEYIYKMYGWLTGVNYCEQMKGYIRKGVIFTKGVKSQEDGLDITSILQDWAHLCKIKFGHLGLVLGDALYLTQLRSLLPLETLEMLQKISSNGQVRIQIIYNKNNSQYIWSANVHLKDFKVKEMGTKFLQRYPPQQQLHPGIVILHEKNCLNLQRINWNDKDCSHQCKKIQLQLDTTSEILYNSINFVSLESSSTFDRSNFRKAIYQTPLLCYLLHYSSLYEPISSKQLVTPIPRPKVIESVQKKALQYPDWVLYRYQNCIQEWRRCSVREIDDGIGFVQFPHQFGKIERQIESILEKRYGIERQEKIICKAAAFQVWEMSENLLGGQQNQENNMMRQMRKKNQIESMRTIKNFGNSSKGK